MMPADQVDQFTADAAALKRDIHGQRLIVAPA